MDNPGEIMRLCRLCLVKDQVNIPIFDEQGDIRQIFLKISSCLPVKVSKEDQLPKSICDGCSNKLDLLYEFRNSSVNAEKALLSWVSQAIKDVDETVGVATQPVAKPSETQVKEETLEECHAPLVHSNDSMDAQESAAFDENSAKEESDEPPPPKRARRTAAVKAQINIAPDSDDEDDDDLDIDAEPLTKIEDESDESDGDEKDDPSYPDVPGTSADDQPGPSGVGKDGVEAPLVGISWQCNKCQQKFTTLPDLQVHMNAKCRRTKAREDQTSDAHVMKIIVTDDDDEVEEDPNCDENPNKLTDILQKLQNSNVKITRAAASKSKEKCFWSCSQCPQVFSSEKRLNEHLVGCLWPSETPPKLKKTRKQDTKNEDETEELYYFSKLDNVYICSICGTDSPDELSMETHVKEHGTLSCKTCQKKFISIVNLGYHSSNHNIDNSYTCPCCSFSTRNKSKLSYHILEKHETESGESKFVCVVCTREFCTHSRLLIHQRGCHQALTISQPSMGARLEKSNETKAYLCDICGKNFSSTYRLERHIKGMHEMIRPYECSFCGRAFTGKDTMKKHERIHTGEKPYSCEYCGRCFRQQGPFNVHLRIHTGERPYVCKFCKRGFITNQSKKTHMNSCRGRNFLEIVEYDNV